LFLPTSREELKILGWEQLDIILVSGDTYIDSPFDGIALIGKVLLNAGWKVGIIAQPDINSDIDICRLGEPRLFWGVSSGCVDSMVANYTALKKKRRSDDMTPGGLNNRRPDRATIIYTNLIKRYFKSNKPIILGGIEASLRRVAHYDYWDDKIRRSVLFDSKADALVYGMGEKAILELAKKINNNEDYGNIRGICRISGQQVDDFIELPSFEEVKNDKLKFIQMYHSFYQNNNPYSANGLMQKHSGRWLLQNPPSLPPTQKELDGYYELDFMRDVHPYYKAQGKIKALETIQFSVTSHRGCFGECNFCSIVAHQGKFVQSRSEHSIIKEVKKLIEHKSFKGIISDIGGPTSNMFDMGCSLKMDVSSKKCKRKCLSPTLCKNLNLCHKSQIKLLQKIRNISGINHVFIGSGVRFDLIMDDNKNGNEFLKEIVSHHVSGQLKIAPEHTNENVLLKMGKPTKSNLKNFKEKFDSINKSQNMKQFLTYYFIAAHPGCTLEDMKSLKSFVSNELNINPEQIQIFTPTPSTYSTLMYYTGLDPFTLKPVFIEKDFKKKEEQKNILVKKWQKNSAF
jgi:uncharacterized radical SAM protein YgiQ